jgi:hypothetical protein
LSITSGDIGDYERLSRFHYRDGRLGPYASIFVIRPDAALFSSIPTQTIAVIVYTMPTSGLELRNQATGGLFVGLDRSTRMSLINKNIRRIARVIVDPRFRGLGLAGRLVRETMPKMNVPIIEAVAVMGIVNPFFEKAGMRGYRRPMTVQCILLIEALSKVGIEDADLVDPQKVQEKLDGLGPDEMEFVESQLRLFLGSYGKRRTMRPGMERTRFVLSKLTAPPVYYIWFNKELGLKV